MPSWVKGKKKKEEKRRRKKSTKEDIPPLKRYSSGTPQLSLEF
jgi:hypothetical protein